jgi:hypothetical protein
MRILSRNVVTFHHPIWNTVPAVFLINSLSLCRGNVTRQGVVLTADLQSLLDCQQKFSLSLSLALSLSLSLSLSQFIPFLL